MSEPSGRNGDPLESCKGVAAMSDQLPFFAAVDWGTTRLRIWLLDETGAALTEHRSDRGFLAVRDGLFADVLEQELGRMGAHANIPAVICGMAGSKQGWLEVPYLRTPVALDQFGRSATRVGGSGRPVFILPGAVRHSEGEADVMRGEETQIAGAPSLPSEGVRHVCLPGTHSKWAEVRNSELTTFTTYMTGEVFALCCEHSILRHSVGADRAVSPDNPFFKEQLRDSIERPDALLTRMFSVRAKGLVAGLSQVDAAAALSGHLIGSEIGSVRKRVSDGDGRVLLLASGPIASLYEEALRQADIGYDVEDADKAVRTGLYRAARVCLG